MSNENLFRCFVFIYFFEILRIYITVESILKENNHHVIDTLLKIAVTRR